MLLQAFLEGVTEDLFPVLGQVPVFGRRIPIVGIGHVQQLHGFLLGRIAVAARRKLGLDVQPGFRGKLGTAGDEFLWRR